MNSNKKNSTMISKIGSFFARSSAQIFVVALAVLLPTSIFAQSSGSFLCSLYGLLEIAVWVFVIISAILAILALIRRSSSPGTKLKGLVWTIIVFLVIAIVLYILAQYAHSLAC